MYLFEHTDIGEVWGIGRRISQQLKEAGIKTVKDFVELDPGTIRKRFSVTLERTWRELQGQSCIDLEEIPAAKKEIAYTRTFGQPVRDLVSLTEAVTEFTSRAAEKLRKQHSLASSILVFIHTSKHRSGPQYARSITVPLVRPASDTHSLLSAALRGLRTIYKPGYDLIKAGVILMDLSSTIVQQTELNFSSSMSDKADQLMQTIDKLNDRYGRGTIIYGSAGIGKKGWSMNQQRKTPSYTAKIKDIPIAVG